MSAFLYLPGILVVLFRRQGLFKTIGFLIAMISAQIWMAMPFLWEHPRSYLKNAFDFSRVFLYEWTVNWRFFGEKTFLSPTLAIALLLLHIVVLVSFGMSRWCRKDGGTIKVLSRGLRRPTLPAGLIPLEADGEISTT